MLKLRALFWRFAHRRYHGLAVNPAFERVMYGIAAFFAAVFAFAYFDNAAHTLELVHVGVILVIVPLIFALLHRRIRRERAKGRYALQEKRQATDPDYHGRRSRRKS